jgi:6-phosphogluconate dehydrogenase
MQLAMIGLGRMGGNMTERLMRGGHTVVAYDRDPATVQKYQQMGATAAADLAQVVGKLQTPRIIWIMVPAGKPVDGLENGYCLMVGGDTQAVKHCEPIFLTLAPKDGYLHVGPPGAGHYVKMVHNGIEYGLLQAYAEGYEVLAASKKYPDLDLGAIAELWQHGSVVRSWLNELAVAAFERDPRLEKLKGYVADSGEGRWTVAEAIEEDVPAPVITLSLIMRLRSRQPDSFSGKVIAALRNEFGGHAVKGS